MLRLLRSEIFRLRRRWMPWVLLFFVVALTAGLYFLIYASVEAQLSALRSGQTPLGNGNPATEAQLRQQLLLLRPAAMLQFGLGVVGGFGAIVLIVLTASVFGSEFNWGTLRVILAFGTARERFLGAKYAALALYALLFTTAGAITALLSSKIVASLASLDATLPPDLVTRLPAAILTTTFTFMPYVALAALIAVWAKSGGAGIAIGLVVYFAEGLVTSLLVAFNRDLAGIADYGLSRNARAINSLYDLPSGAPNPASAGAALPDAGHAALTLLAYTAVFIGLALWRFRSRDLTAS